MVTPPIPPRKKFQIIQVHFGKYWPKFKIRSAWSLDCKTKTSTKEIEEERNEINKCTLQQKQKQNKKIHGEKLEWEVEKTDEMRQWYFTVIRLNCWRRRIGETQRGRQHKLTKMSGNLKLRSGNRGVWLEVCGWENTREKKN